MHSLTAAYLTYNDDNHLLGRDTCFGDWEDCSSETLDFVGHLKTVKKTYTLTTDKNWPSPVPSTLSTRPDPLDVCDRENPIRHPRLIRRCPPTDPNQTSTYKPTREDIALIRSRLPQFRSGVKAIARPLVPGAYGLQDIRTLSNPTPERIADAVGKNRKRVEVILKTYVYKDPDDITVPNTMFRNDIFQHVLNGYWFGKKDQRASYFKDITHLELVTLALIIVAVLCAIEEWTTGKWVEKEFSHKMYFQQYMKILGGLHAWKAHSTQQVSEKGAPRNLTLDALEELLTNPWSVATCPISADEEEGEEDGMFSLAAFEANAA
ncbi:hypothetical protein B0H11DRAFT_2232276 [Mycena galericulata]|nr:hypothetical protein B0H11DRAFT_2232276 [Mycena galericulata]